MKRLTYSLMVIFALMGVGTFLVVIFSGLIIFIALSFNPDFFYLALRVGTGAGFTMGFFYVFSEEFKQSLASEPWPLWGKK